MSNREVQIAQGSVKIVHLLAKFMDSIKETAPRNMNIVLNYNVNTHES